GGLPAGALLLRNLSSGLPRLIQRNGNRLFPALHFLSAARLQLALFVFFHHPVNLPGSLSRFLACCHDSPFRVSSRTAIGVPVSFTVADFVLTLCLGNVP